MDTELQIQKSLLSMEQLLQLWEELKFCKNRKKMSLDGIRSVLIVFGNMMQKYSANISVFQQIQLMQ
jgi:hypothetical protein